MTGEVAYRLMLGALLMGAAAAQVAGAPNPFAGEIRAFEAADRAQPPPAGGILFVGSSSIRIWNVPECFPGLDALNRGFGGSQISDSLHYMGRIILPYKPRLIVFYAGDNDLASGKSPEQVAADFETLVGRIHRALPETRLVFISIKPSLARWQLAPQFRRANKLIREFIEGDDRVQYLNVWPLMIGKDKKPRPELFQADGLHLNADGYRLWTAALRPYLK